MIRSFRSKSLKRLWTKGDASAIRPDWLNKVTALLTALDRAGRPKELEDVGGFHALKGNQAGRFAITVSRNWRLTFGWEDEDAVDVDLEDYHGS